MKKIILFFVLSMLGGSFLSASYCLNNAKNPEALISCLKIDVLSQLFRISNGLPAAAPRTKPAAGTKSAEVEEIILKVQQFFINFKNSHLNEQGYNYLLGVKSLILPSVGSYRSEFDTFIEGLDKSYQYRYRFSFWRLKTGLVQAFRDLKI